MIEKVVLQILLSKYINSFKSNNQYVKLSMESNGQLVECQENRSDVFCRLPESKLAAVFY